MSDLLGRFWSKVDIGLPSQCWHWLGTNLQQKNVEARKGEKTMKTFKNIAAQGDVLFKKIDTLPEGLKEEKAENGVYVIAHSETGHNHIMKSKHVTLYANDNNPFVAYLVVDNTTTIGHMRGFDTHEPIQFDKGIYEVRRQREYTPEGYRRVQD